MWGDLDAAENLGAQLKNCWKAELGTLFSNPYFNQILFGCFHITIQKQCAIWVYFVGLS